MHFSRLSDEEAREIRDAARDPAYRDMNRVEAELQERLAGRTPLERFDELVAWLGVLASLGARFEPSREVPRADVALL